MTQRSLAAYGVRRHDLPVTHISNSSEVLVPEGLRIKALVPKGLRIKARGCEERATPGPRFRISYATGVVEDRSPEIPRGRPLAQPR
jgi:hypothetical protein